MNIFQGMTVAELLPIRDYLRQRILGGQQTHTAIAPGMYHQFAEKKEAELRRLLEECLEALHELDPDNYAAPQTPPGITRANFGGC